MVSRSTQIKGLAVALLAAVVVATAGLSAAPARAAGTTVTVNTTADNLPAAGECSGVAGDCSLRQAIDTAVSGDTIDFASGVTGTITLAHGQIAFSKTLDIEGPGAQKLTIDAGGMSSIFAIEPVGGPESFTLSGLTLAHGAATGSPALGGAIFSQNAGAVSVSDSVLDFNGATASGGAGIAEGGAIFSGGAVTVTDSTLEHNNASDDTGGIAEGGAILAHGAVSVTGSTLQDNAVTGVGGGGADALGGAIFSQDAVSVTDGTLRANTATATGNGGAEADGGAISSQGALTLTGATLEANTATATGNGGANADGGAISSRDTVDISDSTLDGNAVTGGGAFDNVVAVGGAVEAMVAGTVAGSILQSNTATVTAGDGGVARGGAIVARALSVDGSRLDSNTATTTVQTGLPSGLTGGGAIFADGLTLTGSVLDSNAVASTFAGSDGFASGGAIESQGTVSVTDSTLDSNTVSGSRGGGALFADGRLALSDSTLHGNRTTSSGGALSLTNPTTLQSDTIDGNDSSGSGVGGIAGAGEVTAAEATIVADNATGGPSGASSDCDAPVASSQDSLEDDGAKSCGFDLAAADPELNAPADRDGTSTLPDGSHVPTQSERAGSPAIDAVAQADCPTSVDERGFARPDGGETACDVGAFETEDLSVTIGSPSSGGSYPADTPVPTSFSCTQAAGGPGIESCDDSTGTDTGGGGSGRLDTSTPGPHTYTVTATARDGETDSGSIAYTVVKPVSVATTTPAPPVTTTAAPPTRVARRSCPSASGRLAGRRLGPLALGMTRAVARRSLPRFMVTHNRFDRFCVRGGKIRVAYPSRRLLRTLAQPQRRRLRGRVVLALTANPHYVLDGIRPGTAAASVRPLLRRAQRFRIGTNTWYVLRGRHASGVLKVQHGGIVGEIGIANRALTATRAEQRRLLVMRRRATVFDIMRAGMRREIAGDLLDALRDKTEELQSLDGPLPKTIQSTSQAFAHPAR